MGNDGIRRESGEGGQCRSVGTRAIDGVSPAVIFRYCNFLNFSRVRCEAAGVASAGAACAGASGATLRLTVELSCVMVRTGEIAEMTLDYTQPMATKAFYLFEITVTRRAVDSILYIVDLLFVHRSKSHLC